MCSYFFLQSQYFSMKWIPNARNSLCKLGQLNVSRRHKRKKKKKKTHRNANNMPLPGFTIFKTNHWNHFDCTYIGRHRTDVEIDLFFSLQHHQTAIKVLPFFSRFLLCDVKQTNKETINSSKVRGRERKTEGRWRRLCWPFFFFKALYFRNGIWKMYGRSECQKMKHFHEWLKLKGRHRVSNCKLELPRVAYASIYNIRTSIAGHVNHVLTNRNLYQLTYTRKCKTHRLWIRITCFVIPHWKRQLNNLQYVRSFFTIDYSTCNVL